ncbi:MAG: RIP metalloprotease RseP, partial [Alphaproteobacteria bacterium]
AERAGFMPGDQIISIDGQKIDRFQDLQRIVQVLLDREMKVEVNRDSQTLILNLTPELVDVEDITGRTIPTPRIGITADGVQFQKLGPWDAAKGSITETWEIAVLTLRVVGQIITGRRGTEELGGPVRIAELSGKMVENGAATLIWFMALLSLNLGLINLFPIPVLDGGHLAFYAFEWIRGKPLPERAQAAGYRLGLMVVLALFAFVFWNDLSFYWNN